MAYRSQKTVLEGAIEIYKRDAEGGQHSSDNWYAKLRVPDVGTLRRSLKTSIESEAITKSQKLYFDSCQRVAQGLSLSPKSFTKVAKQFLTYFEQQVEVWKTLDELGKANMKGVSENSLKNTRPIVEKYLIPFFGEKNIQEIYENDIQDYKHFRLGYWTGEEQKKIK